MSPSKQLLLCWALPRLLYYASWTCVATVVVHTWCFSSGKLSADSSVYSRHPSFSLLRFILFLTSTVDCLLLPYRFWFICTSTARSSLSTTSATEASPSSHHGAQQRLQCHSQCSPALPSAAVLPRRCLFCVSSCCLSLCNSCCCCCLTAPAAETLCIRGCSSACDRLEAAAAQKQQQQRARQRCFLLLFTPSGVHTPPHTCTTQQSSSSYSTALKYRSRLHPVLDVIKFSFPAAPSLSSDAPLLQLQVSASSMYVLHSAGRPAAAAVTST